MRHLKWNDFIILLANWISIKQLGRYSLIVFALGLLFIFVADIDRTNATVNLLGVIGIFNWIGVWAIWKMKRDTFDRNLANANLLRLLYIMLLVVSIPCMLNLFFCSFTLPEQLETFNNTFLDPFLNHDTFSFKKSIVSLLGTFLLSGVLVSLLVGLFNQRVEKWGKGELWYELKYCDYCVVVGGHDAVPSLIRQLVEKYKRVIVLTNRDIPSFRREVESYLEESQKEKVIFFHGYRNSKIDLEKLHLERENLTAIYILGESRVHGIENSSEETSHDTLNMTCLDIMNDLRGDEKKQINCYVFFEHQTTSIVFQKFANNQKYKSLNFIPYNFYELQAQKAIGWSEFLKQDEQQENPLRLDRFGTDVVNAEKHVHLVIVGMSKMGQALGLEAIRVCHYPNYAKSQMLYEYEQDECAEEKMMNRRTKITFIDCNMKEILDSFKCRYGRLLNEVNWNYYDYDDSSKPQSHSSKKDDKKIIPDIELEFVNGRIQSEEVIKHLTSISIDNSAVLTIASCLSKSNQSIASILCLPKEILEKAEILIYQPDSTKLVESIAINDNSEKVRAFGEVSQAVNLQHIVALESMAKRVNNVYLKKTVWTNSHKTEESTERMTLFDFSEKAMQEFEYAQKDLCDSAWMVKDYYKIEKWEMTETKRWANRYHASAIWQKYPYIVQKINHMEEVIKKGITDDDGCVQEEFEGLMVRAEHNRYCIEQWLLDRKVPGSSAFKSYVSLNEDGDTDNDGRKFTEFPTNDQIMTMAIPYIVDYSKESD